MMEGIYVCAAPHCLKSFLKKTEFESHIYNNHADLLQPNMKKEDINEPEASSAKQASTMDTTLRGPPRPGFPSNMDTYSNDRDDKGRRPQPRDQPPLRPLMPPMPPPQWSTNPSGPQFDPWAMGMQQQNPDLQGGQFSDKQQGILPDQHREYPQMYSRQPPNFPMHGNSNQMMLGPPPFGFPPFPSDGTPPFFGGSVPYELSRSDSTQEGGPVNFPEGYSRPWNAGPTNNTQFEATQSGQGVLAAPQSMAPPPPPPGPPPHLLQHQNSYFSGDMSTDGNNYGWQSERRDSFGGSQD